MVTSTERRTVTVLNPAGLHMRPAAAVAKCAQAFRAAIKVSHGGKTVDCKSPLGLITLIAVSGSLLTIEADGADDAREAADRISALLADPGDGH